MGITARGAWQSVIRHFREMGINPRRADFTCVGIGDMSGDVFGNGMLLSEHIKLVAAFDHRHVFIDPDPDPARSFEERKRLFAAAPVELGQLRRESDLRGRRDLPPDAEVDQDHARDAYDAGDRRVGRVALARGVDHRLLVGPGGPAVERRDRHLRQGDRGKQRAGRRQGERRPADQRQPAAGQVRGRGRQPRSDPARPDRVRQWWRSYRHRLHRQLRRASTPPTTRSTSRSCSPAR